jgi:hypothetical protein
MVSLRIAEEQTRRNGSNRGDMWGVEQWRAAGAVLSGVAQVAGVVGGGWYFFAQKRHGAQKPNLSVSIACERRASNVTDTDWLSITVTLKKLDRGMLALKLVRGRLCEDRIFKRQIEFWGYRLAEVAGVGKHGQLTPGDELNLTPGEETQLAAVIKVPADVACEVNLVIRAFQHGDDLEGQWQASAVSLPRERREEPAQPKGIEGAKGDAQAADHEIIEPRAVEASALYRPVFPLAARSALPRLTGTLRRRLGF